MIACSTEACGGNSIFAGAGARKDGGGFTSAAGAEELAGAADDAVGGGSAMSTAAGSFEAGGGSGGGADDVPPPQETIKIATERRLSTLMVPRLPECSALDQAQGLPNSTDSHLVALAASFGWLTSKCHTTAQNPSVCGVIRSGETTGMATHASATCMV